MADQRKGGISWTDETWNPIRGCSRVSAGCANCYAERLSIRMAGPGEKYDGLVKMTKDGPRWTGKVKLFPEDLDKPKHWTRPRRIFVNAMSDLFHEALQDEEIFAVFKAMASAPQHVFQVLTKRSKRMRDLVPRIRGHLVDRLEHVWLGVSVEHQEAAAERVPDLLDTPAEVRWLSVEPMVGPVDLLQWLPIRDIRPAGGGIDWVVVGGESGHNARPMQPEWPRQVRDACQNTGVAFHFKQWGEWHPERYGHVRLGKRDAGRLLDGRTWDEYPR